MNNVPDAREAEIIRRNGIDPREVAVQTAGDDRLVLLNYKTRDTIIIFQGDKKW